MIALGRKVRELLRMIVVEHTVFALPFAYAGAFLAAGGRPTAHQLIWITVAMAGARSAALGLNRIIDRRIDAKNPRTSGRHLPSGRVRVWEAALFSAFSLAVLAFAAWQLNPLCVALLPLVVVALVVYPYAKRFTWTCHYWMVPAQFFAPFGGWIAVTGAVEAGAVILGLAVGLWIAAFDILYALQDIEFDRRAGIHSLPAALGVSKALWVSRLTHLVVLVLLVSLGFTLRLGPSYLVGVTLAGALLAYQHLLVSPSDISRAARAFNVNLAIGPVLLAGVLAGLLV